MIGRSGASGEYAANEVVPWLAWLTWKRLLLGVAVFTGGWLRLYWLDFQPLNTLEAAYAWSSWRLAEGLDPTWSGANPLFLSLQSALFWLMGGSDVWARLLSATAGIGVVLLAASWGRVLGRGTALLFALLLAVSPWQVGVSRLGDGSVIALLLGMGVITLLYRLLISYPDRTENTGGTYGSPKADGVAATFGEPSMQPAAQLPWLGALAGLFLISGPLAWTFLILIGLWLVMPGSRAGVQALESGMRRQGRKALVWLGIAVTLGATGWLARPGGAGGLSSSLSVWAGHFGLSGDLSHQLYSSAGGSGSNWFWLRLSADQPMLTLLGLVGLVAAWRSHLNPQTKALPWLPGITLWFALGFLMLQLPGDLPGGGYPQLAFFSIPVLLSAAWLLAHLLSRVPIELDRGEAASVGVTLLILLAAAWIWATGLVATLVLDLVVMQAIVAIMGMFVLLLVLYAYWSGIRALVWVVSGVLLVLILAGSLRTAWSGSMWNQARTPLGVRGEMTHQSVRLLVADLETLSAQRTGDPRRMQIYLEPGLLAWQPTSAANASGMHGSLVQVTDPVLAWYLRGFESVTWPERAPLRRPGEPVAYITPLRVRGTGLTLSDVGGETEGVYAETRYPVRTLWTPLVPGVGQEAAATTADRLQQRWRGVWRPMLRWYMYREPPIAPLYQEARLRLVLNLSE